MHSVSATATHASVQPVEQHAGMAPHTAITQGSAPQSWAARVSQLASHEALPQHVDCCAHTLSTQGLRHVATVSAAPTSQAECEHAAVGPQPPQSAAHDVQSSPMSHTPLPQQPPHVLSASPTHWLSHAVVQQ